MDKTTCPDHRRLGYHLSGGKYICKGCGLPEAQHETAAETVKRKQNSTT